METLNFLFFIETKRTRYHLIVNRFRFHFTRRKLLCILLEVFNNNYLKVLIYFLHWVFLEFIVSVSNIHPKRYAKNFKDLFQSKFNLICRIAHVMYHHV